MAEKKRKHRDSLISEKSSDRSSISSQMSAAVSTAPSGVSMKSDASMFPPLNFDLKGTQRLAHCNVTAEWIEHLAFALKFSFSALRDLDLSNNDLKDSGVELLCDGLGNPCCRLETLSSGHAAVRCLSRCILPV
ncbi:hypothetical protein PAMP_016000 [Pampus punctatissimus]